MPMPAFNQLNKQQQLAILIGAPVIVAIALIWLNYRSLNRLGADPVLPKFVQRPGGKWAEIAKKVEDIKKQDDIIAKGPEVAETLKKLQADIHQAEERLPKEAEKAEMSEVITRLGREIPVEIGTVQFKRVDIKEAKKETGPKAKGDDYQTVAYRTEIEGNLNGIIKYIDSIEKNARFMTIKELTVKPGGLSNDGQKIVYGLHQVTMEIVTYIYNPPQKAAPKDR